MLSTLIVMYYFNRVNVMASTNKAFIFFITEQFSVKPKRHDINDFVNSLNVRVFQRMKATYKNLWLNVII